MRWVLFVLGLLLAGGGAAAFLFGTDLYAYVQLCLEMGGCNGFDGDEIVIALMLRGFGAAGGVVGLALVAGGIFDRRPGGP